MSLQSLFDNPLDLLLPVLNRMEAQALCRFRQTSKQVDTLVEVNRKLITSFHDVQTYIGSHSICGPYHKIGMGVSHLVGRYIWRRCDLYDPYKQLSAINCRRIRVYFQREDEDVEKAAFVATLRKLGLKCKLLTISKTYRDELDVILSANMATHEVQVNEPICPNDIHKWPIKHLKCSFQLKELDRLSKHVKDIRDVLLNPIRELKQEEVTRWLHDFLMEVRENRTARGRLEHLTIKYGKGSLVEEYPGIRLLHRGYFLNRSPSLRYKICSEIQKLEIDGGFGLVIRTIIPYGNPDFTHIYFLSSDSREGLFNAFSSYNDLFFRDQLDITDKKEDFLMAKDDETAFALLFPENKPLTG